MISLMGKNVERANVHRLAIVNPDRCKPSQCALECKKSCPVNRIGKPCITVTKKDKISVISEVLCIGCGCCVKACPFNAISIVNVPKALSKDASHRYGVNGFKLHKLPIPRLGSVLGLVGSNGVGKSTCLRVLSGELRPNLGKIDPDWMQVLNAFKGSELFSYFTKLLSSEMVVSLKKQYVDTLPNDLKCTAETTVAEILKKHEKSEFYDYCLSELELYHLMNKKVQLLSGGEMQRLAIASCVLEPAQIFFLDEPSSFLDVKQRLSVCKLIRKLIRPDVYIIVVEHDLAVLDAMCDFGCVLYGVPGVYGVVTAPYVIKQGVNCYLSGYIPAENIRFRDKELTFAMCERPTESVDREMYTYKSITHSYVLKNDDSGPAASVPNDDNATSKNVVQNENTLDQNIRESKLNDPKSGIQSSRSLEIEEPSIDTTVDLVGVQISPHADIVPEDLNLIRKTSQKAQNSTDMSQDSIEKCSEQFTLNDTESGQDLVVKNNELGNNKHILTESLSTMSLSTVSGSTYEKPTKSYRLSKTTQKSTETKTKQTSDGTFNLQIEGGSFSKSEIIVLLGENGTGKSTYLNLLKNQLSDDKQLIISIKPQKIIPKYRGTMKDLFMSKIRAAFLDTYFQTEVMKPLNIDYLLDNKLSTMSGGELQRVAIALTLGRKADIYMFDEPSAFLDCDQRIAICRIIKKFCYTYSKTCFVVEHDLIVGTYLADKIVVFSGSPGVSTTASPPLGIEEAMNMFLKRLDVTFRRDIDNLRPRVNKHGSAKDREQKEKGTYFFS